MGAIFFLNSILLGFGLAMDAFSVSLANGLHEPAMPRGRRCLIAGTFAFFQFLMPLLGWLCVRTVVERFRAAERFVPWIALGLLLCIGGTMLRDGLRGGEAGEVHPGLGAPALLLQGVATSIDALSVGFTLASYDAGAALTAAALIAAVTFAVCIGGLHLGRRLGTYLADRASILGGAILIAIGLEIFLRGVL